MRPIYGHVFYFVIWIFGVVLATALILSCLPRHVHIGKQDILLTPGKWPTVGVMVGLVVCVVGVAMEGRAIVRYLRTKEESGPEANSR